MPPRRVNVFARVDGACLYDVVWQPQPAAPPVPAADKVWPLINNFTRLSREVDGGALRRLVFRSPRHYAPTVRSFDPVVARVEQHAAPVVIHALCDARYVVSVTERVPDLSPFAHSPFGAAFTLREFCENILHLLRNEHAAFVADGAGGGDGGGDAAGSPSREGQQSPRSRGAATRSTDSQGGAAEAAVDTHTLRAVVQQSKLREMIDNTMKLVQL